MKILIIEDEKSAAFSLKSKLESLNKGIDIVAITANIRDSISFISSNPNVDIIFADIRLEDGYSFDIFDKINVNAFIVFTTAYDEYTLRAFEYNCLNYILKPISVQDLNKVFEKYDRNLLISSIKNNTNYSSILVEEKNRYRSKIRIQLGNEEEVISVDDICLIEYDNGILKIYRNNGLYGYIYGSLSSIQTQFDPKTAIRVSRNHLVFLKYIWKISRFLTRKKIICMKYPWDTINIETTSHIAKQIKQLLL